MPVREAEEGQQRQSRLHTKLLPSRPWQNTSAGMPAAELTLVLPVGTGPKSSVSVDTLTSGVTSTAFSVTIMVGPSFSMMGSSTEKGPGFAFRRAVCRQWHGEIAAAVPCPGLCAAVQCTCNGKLRQLIAHAVATFASQERYSNASDSYWAGMC